MTSRDFCYWLQGYLEIASVGCGETESLTIKSKEVEVIQKHLNMVFVHEIDPTFSENQVELNQIHSSKPNKPVARC